MTDPHQTVIGRNATPRSVPNPDPDRVDPQPNAGRIVPGRYATAAELAAQAAAGASAAMCPSLLIPKTTMPLRGCLDESLSSIAAQEAEQRQAAAQLAAFAENLLSQLG